MAPVSKSRNQQIQDLIRSRVSTEPYDNIRPTNVPAKFDGQTLFQCLVAMHPHVSPEQWQEWFRLGHILKEDRPVSMETIVRGGNQFQHLFPDWLEPEVDSRIEILWEDDSIIAVAKPAPLPVHPSGRFNRNTLTALLGKIYSSDDLRVVHRLDANTTGVMIFARTASIATAMRNQFEANRVCNTFWGMARISFSTKSLKDWRRDLVAKEMLGVSGGCKAPIGGLLKASGDTECPPRAY